MTNTLHCVPVTLSATASRFLPNRKAVCAGWARKTQRQMPTLDMAPQSRNLDCNKEGHWRRHQGTSGSLEASWQREGFPQEFSGGDPLPTYLHERGGFWRPREVPALLCRRNKLAPQHFSQTAGRATCFLVQRGPLGTEL